MKKILIIFVIMGLIIFGSGLIFAGEVEVEEGLMHQWLIDEDEAVPSGVIPKGNFEFVEGKVGDALQFDGETTYLEIDEEIDVQPENMTVALWIKRTEEDWSGEEHVVFWGKEDAGWDGNGWFLTLDARGDEEYPVRIWIDETNIFEHEGDINEFYPEGEWVHIAASFDSTLGMTAIYRNGEEVESVDNIDDYSLTPSESPTWMGFNSPEFDAAYINAAINDFRIYDRFLIEDEIKEIIEYAESN